MVDNNRSLDELLVDEEELNESLMVETLNEFIGIGSESGDLVRMNAFNDLDAQQKVAVVLLAQKARFALDKVQSEWLGPSEISDVSGIKKGTVYPAVRELENDGLADNEDGKYRIPTHTLKESKSYILDDD